MGMSASQARLLSITARMNDVEFKSQSISNTKLRLADESEQVSRDYTDALNKQKLTYTDWSSGQATKISLNSTTMSNVASSIKLYTIGGKEVVYDETDVQDPDKQVYMTFSEAELYEMIESGQFIMYSSSGKIDATAYAALSDTNKGAYINVNGEYWKTTSVSGNGNLAMESDSTMLAKAEAEYNAATSRINRKEKLLDNELKALDTEHSALKTEQDAIKSLISDNVDKTFNIFS